MNRLSFSFAALALLALGSLVACGEAGSSAGAQLTVESFEFTRLEDGTRVFTGKVYNPTDESVRAAQISVSLFDTENRRVGSTSVRVRDIAPRDTTAFRQIFDSDQEVSGVRMRSLTVM